MLDQDVSRQEVPAINCHSTLYPALANQCAVSRKILGFSYTSYGLSMLD